MHIFLAICLHANENGWAWPSVKLLEKETGYNGGTINDALNALCELKINGEHLLLKLQPKSKENGKFHSNHYLIFPSQKEIEEYEDKGIQHTVGNLPSTENPVTVKPTDEEEPVFKEEPTKHSADAEKTELTGEAALVEFFGERKESVKKPMHTHWMERRNQPWAGWSDGRFHEQDGVSADSQDRVAWLVERYGALRPAGSYTGWQNGAIGAYLAGRGDWGVIEDGIREAFAREPKFRPKTLACSKRTVDTNSIVKAIAGVWSDRHKPVVVIGTPTDQPILRIG